MNTTYKKLAEIKLKRIASLVQQARDEISAVKEEYKNKKHVILEQQKENKIIQLRKDLGI